MYSLYDHIHFHQRFQLKEPRFTHLTRIFEDEAEQIFKIEVYN